MKPPACRIFFSVLFTRDILRDLSCLNRGLSHIRIFESQIPDHRESSASDGASHIQVSHGIVGQIHSGILYISLNSSVIVGCHEDSPDGAVPIDLYSQKILGTLEHVRHHKRGRHRPPQSRRGYRGQIVRLSCALHQVPGCNRKGADLRVPCRCPYHIVHISQFSPLFFPGSAAPLPLFSVFSQVLSLMMYLGLCLASR